MSVDRQRELIRQASQPEEPGPVPRPGAQCRVPDCSADTRLGTLSGGAPMLCRGFPLAGRPCIARWLTETETGSYETWSG